MWASMRQIILAAFAVFSVLGPATVAARAQMMQPPRGAAPTPPVGMAVGTPPGMVYTTPGMGTSALNPGVTGRTNPVVPSLNQFANPSGTGWAQAPLNPYLNRSNAAGLNASLLLSQANPYAGLGGAYGAMGSGNSSYGYGGNGASGGYGNGYGESTEGGYLRGAAQLVESQGKYLGSLQQASLIKEQVRQAKIDTRRKQFDEFVREQSRTLTFEDQRQAADKERVMHSLNNPTEGEILSGQALNDILREISKADDKTFRGPAPVLDADLMKCVNLTSGKGGLDAALLKQDTAWAWPLALSGEASRADRDLVSSLLPQARRLAQGSRADDGMIKMLDAASSRLHQKLSANVSNISAKTYISTSRFLRQMDDAIRLLAGRDAADYLSRQIPQDVKDVADLVGFMIRKGLRFAPAAAGDESAYLALHRALAAYDKVTAYESGQSEVASDRKGY
jgi:hypothetical protein